MSRAPQELEKTTAQGQMEAINGAMMNRVIWAYGKLIHEHGHLPEIAKEEVGQMMVIAAEVDQHFQKQGSLEGLKVGIGSCLKQYDQGLYMTNSLIAGLIDQKEKETFNSSFRLGWSSTVEGLEIRREDMGDQYGYFLADKKPTWTEA